MNAAAEKAHRAVAMLNAALAIKGTDAAVEIGGFRIVDAGRWLKRQQAAERPETVEVGQIWRDLDTRSAGAGEFEVIGVPDDQMTSPDRKRVQVLRAGRRLHIRLDRLLGIVGQRTAYEYVGRAR